MWVEKYRPPSLSHVVSQDHLREVLDSCLKTGSFPNFLFYGPPGTGKTTSILAFCQDLFGADWRLRTMELNASDDRGIQTVRKKIKGFAERHMKGLKMIILDEADSLTSDAQSALRRVMENYPNTRFCILCNYQTKIIKPIRSRCVAFQFYPLSEEDVIKRLRHVVEGEGLDVTDEAYKALYEASGGDMRYAISLLEQTAIFYSTITADTVHNVVDAIPEELVTSLLNLDEVEAYNEFVSTGYNLFELLERWIKLVNDRRILFHLAFLVDALKQGSSPRFAFYSALKKIRHVVTPTE